MSQLPPPTAPVWENLVTGKINHKFDLFAANMAIARVTRVAASDPSQKTAMITELRQFFEKYENLTADELQSLC